MTQLRTLILTGEYAPGDKLPPERKLAEQLSVNRTSVREALKKLEHIGLVKTRQGDGTRVQDFMAEAGIDILSHLVPIMESDHQGALLRDVLEFRKLYGREIARLAAERRDEDDLLALESIAQAAAQPKATLDEVLALDFDFYVAMTRATKNKVLILLINTSRRALLPHSPFFSQIAVSVDFTADHQRALIDAIRARDTDTAADTAERYLQQGADHLLSLFGVSDKG